MQELENYVLNNDKQTQFFNLELPEIPESMKTFIRNYRNIKHAFIINENLEYEAEYDDVAVDFIKLDSIEYDAVLSNILDKDLQF